MWTAFEVNAAGLHLDAVHAAVIDDQTVVDVQPRAVVGPEREVIGGRRAHGEITDPADAELGWRLVTPAPIQLVRRDLRVDG